MAFDNSFTAVTGATYTAAQYNTYTKGNFTAIWVGTTAGDMEYYASSTSKSRLGIGNSYDMLRVNSGGTAPEWNTPRLTMTSLTDTNASLSRTNQAMTWATELVDDDGWHVAGDSKITVNETNRYRITFQIGTWMPTGAAVNNYQIWLNKDGSNYVYDRRAFKENGDLCMLGLSIAGVYNSGTYFEVYIPGTQVIGGTYSFFSVTKERAG